VRPRPSSPVRLRTVACGTRCPERRPTASRAARSRESRATASGVIRGWRPARAAAPGASLHVRWDRMDRHALCSAQRGARCG
jgi:hypothetical protein